MTTPEKDMNRIELLGAIASYRRQKEERFAELRETKSALRSALQHAEALRRTKILWRRTTWCALVAAGLCLALWAWTISGGAL